MDIEQKRRAGREAINKALLPLVQSLIRHKDEIDFKVIDRQIGLDPGLVVMIKPHRSDFARLYGKMRRNYDALETIAVYIGMKLDLPIRLGRLIEGGPGDLDRFEEKGDWENGGRQKFLNMMAAVSEAIFRGDRPKVELVQNEFDETVLRIHVSPDGPSYQQSKFEALEVLSKSVCAAYGKLPTVELLQDLNPIQS